MQTLVNFYDPYIQGKNTEGRTLDYILSQPDAWLERTHNFIQWLFPLPRPSQYNPTAPLLDRATAEYMGEHPRFQEQLRLSVIRMMWFYGFQVQFDPAHNISFQVAEDPVTLENPYRRWFKRQDHNHLRISRMIKSLRYFDMQEEAIIVYSAFVSINEQWGLLVPDPTVRRWTDASEENIY
ncbi:opioid growth factor receptor conserved domain-containing protein [Hypoxylon cercidicola]|nr:opioid growth factor receptor conserved domain-containing protein [Hypoxylon cercidicola]